jgi:Protein of unknown function (DUF3800)
MPTFIDESGDTGPVAVGGKPYFRLAAVWIPSHEEAEAFRDSIRQLRVQLGVKADYEFKFAKTHGKHAHRAAFFDRALQTGFRFAVCSIDKTSGDWANASSQEIHWGCATSLAVILRPTYHQAEETKTPLREPIIVDDNADGSFLKIVKGAFSGLKATKKPALVGPVKFRKSAPDELLHLADMVCGSVGAHLDGNDSAWYKAISSRDVGTFCLP